MSAIEVRNLVKKFHGQTVLHGIDLDVIRSLMVSLSYTDEGGKSGCPQFL